MCAVRCGQMHLLADHKADMSELIKLKMATVNTSSPASTSVNVCDIS